MDSIATYCPVLEILSIKSAHPTDELFVLSDIVRSCKQLVDLSCPSLDFAAWKHLSNAPTLLTVEIDERRILHRPMDAENLHFAPFLNLTTLTFHVETCGNVVTVLRHSQFPSLKEFKIYINVLPWAEAEQLFCALSLRKACDALERIEISSYDSGLSPKPLTVVRRFLCFQQLRILRLAVNHPIYLDNDLLLEAMLSWPHIHSLELEDPPFRAHPPTVTFRGLFAALRLSPQLRGLLVSMDAVNIDIDSTTESLEHTSLRTWSVLHSLIVDPGAVAQIIFFMLPCINSVAYDDDYDDPEEPNLWRKVNSLLYESAAHNRHNARTAPTI
ncbi:hypothetical protein AZE42_07175 [Rhizopogon vesiculosus]|uniref:F-box domain-containing protein n=1 Tax=Rhizopogon vesiculosus TaxID=180088 RepID=A0A1J8QBR7_9AGAM|nr:hypothetical protein AZE42_07175 [Rhizopogon vesiculosus]